MWFWRRMEKFVWTDHVRTEEELETGKANWISHILLRKWLMNTLLKERYKEGYK
jgi:hypothetical protein